MDLAAMSTPDLQAAYRKVLQDVEAGLITPAAGVAARAPYREELEARGEGTHPDVRKSTPESRAKAQTLRPGEEDELARLRQRIKDLEEGGGR